MTIFTENHHKINFKALTLCIGTYTTYTRVRVSTYYALACCS